MEWLSDGGLDSDIRISNDVRRRIGISLKNGVYPLFKEPVHLLRGPAHEISGVHQVTELILGHSECGVSSDSFQKVGPGSLLFHAPGRVHGMTANSLVKVLSVTEPGTTMPVTVMRGGEEVVLEVSFEE